MRRQLITTTFGAVLLLGAACSDDPPGTGTESGLSSEDQTACEGYSEVISNWGQKYGQEVGAVGAAAADGDEERREEAVTTIRDLFLVSAEDLLIEAKTAKDEDLTASLQQASQGLSDIAEQIKTYEDVESAPELMDKGDFAAGGESVSQFCAS
jgi:HEAT repeat protein